jgi:hypothetical protein
MIGGCTNLAHALPNNCTIGVIYSYDSAIGYKRILKGQPLEPGKGYWISFKGIIYEAELRVEVLRFDL